VQLFEWILDFLVAVDGLVRVLVVGERPREQVAVAVGREQQVVAGVYAKVRDRRLVVLLGTVGLELVKARSWLWTVQ